MYMYVCDYDKNMHRRDVIYTTALWYKANSTCVIVLQILKNYTEHVYIIALHSHNTTCT